MTWAKLRALPIVGLLAPIDFIVVCAILAADIVSLPLRWIHARPVLWKPPDTTSATVQILNWDGLHLLKECLPAVLAAVRQHSIRAAGRIKVTVVDNGSRDGSVDYLRQNFPDVRVVTLDRNYGFSIGNNKGFAHVDTDVVILLNNDMIVSADFLAPLLLPFSDPAVFAVASRLFFANPARRQEETGKTAARFERGFLRLWHAEIDPREEAAEAIPVFWAGGGCCAVDLRKLRSIGGFDTLYHPFYVEDTDISWQAWKRGWKCLLAPKSHVVHKHRGTSRPKFGDDFVDRAIRRNLFLFIWKNVTAPGLTLRHLMALPRIHGSAILNRGARFEIAAYARALIRLPLALLRRVANLREYVVSDRDVLRSAQ